MNKLDEIYTKLMSQGIINADDSGWLISEVAQLRIQKDALIGAIYEHCDTLSAPYLIADEIEGVDGN